MVVKQFGSRVAQLAGGAKVGHSGGKEWPEEIVVVAGTLGEVPSFLSCEPYPTRVPNTDHHDFPPKLIDELWKDTASIVIRAKARKKKNMYSTYNKTVGRLLFQGPQICDLAGKEPPQASPSLMSRYLAVIMPKAETSMGIVINPAEHNDM